MNMEEKLIQLTEKLLHYNQLFLKYFESAREKQMKVDFHLVVQPFANEVKAVNDEWSDLLKKWINENSLKHLNINQLDSTYEHLERSSIQAFYPETSKSRFFNANRATEYFLSGLLKELSKKRDCL